jgi:hypothetical protein
MSNEYTKIPRSVLKFLGDAPWIPKIDHFDRLFAQRGDDPSYDIFYRSGGADDDKTTGAPSLSGEMPYNDVVGMHKDGVFGSLSRTGKNPETLAVNEHVGSALREFCSEVYDAWRKFEERRERVERTPTRRYSD